MLKRFLLGKNRLRMWMLIPFAVVFTGYTFYYEIIRNEIPPLFQFPPSINNAIHAWGNQSGVHIAGQILSFQAACLGALALWLIFQKPEK